MKCVRGIDDWDFFSKKGIDKIGSVTLIMGIGFVFYSVSSIQKYSKILPLCNLLKVEEGAGKQKTIHDISQTNTILFEKIISKITLIIRANELSSLFKPISST